MTFHYHKIINDVAEFLANAEMLVQESLDQYSQLADSMELHHKADTAEQFRQLEIMEQQQLKWIQQQAQGIALPNIAPWDVSWRCKEDPEKICLSDLDYLTTPAKALSAALFNEHRSEHFYQYVAGHTRDQDVKILANDMAEQQSEQIKILEQRLTDLPEEEQDYMEDLDPPNMPE